MKNNHKIINLKFRLQKHTIIQLNFTFMSSLGFFAIKRYGTMPPEKSYKRGGGAELEAGEASSFGERML